MKTKITLLSFFLLMFCEVHSQVLITYCMDEPEFVIAYMDISKYKILDSAYLHVTYRVSMMEDTLDRSDISKDDMTLQIGRNVSKFYSETVHENDSVCTELSKNSSNWPLNESGAQGYEVYKFNRTKKITVTNRLPFSNNIYTYEESDPEMKWIIMPEKSDVLGYPCQKAETSFRGRQYVAWFSPEIPSLNGPWKFGGLPGLILKISDTDNQYVFECIGLTKTKEPIKQYEWKSMDVTLKEWNKIETNYHRRAGDFVRSNNLRVKLYKNGALELFPIDWQEPFNPIERSF